MAEEMEAEKHKHILNIEQDACLTTTSQLSSSSIHEHTYQGEYEKKKICAQKLLIAIYFYYYYKK